MATADPDRKQRGAWFTPDHLVSLVVDAVVDAEFVASRPGRRVRVLDPACGDGRFLAAAADAIRAAGGEAELFGVDVDGAAVADARARLGRAGHTGADLVVEDALTSPFLDRRRGAVDLVIGNPPYLSQMAASTTRGGASRHGGGPYADAAVEFLSLGADLVDPRGGRLAFVLPQSILSVRDAGPVRERIDRAATMFWSSWTGERDFDAEVVTCALAFQFDRDDPVASSGSASTPFAGSWSHVVTQRIGVPPVPAALDDPNPPRGRLGDRVTLNANFRDEYYGMVPAVGDHDDGPPLITSGLIDPGRSLWGEVPVKFAKQRFAAPRIDLDLLDDKMSRWASKRLVPKVLVANQTAIIEAVADADGDWLPGVPVVGVYPHDPADVWPVAALLTSPSVSVWAWHRRGGTGLSPTTIRIGPTMLAELAWPSGSLDDAVAALRSGDAVECARSVDAAYGVAGDDADVAMRWWMERLEQIERRRR